MAVHDLIDLHRLLLLQLVSQTDAFARSQGLRRRQVGISWALLLL